MSVESYRIGWWTHRWWPTRGLLECLVTGRQLSPRADNGQRFVGRGKFVRPILQRLRLIRRPHRPWQAEADGVRFARRAFTQRGAESKMQRDVNVAGGVVTGFPIDSPWQLRRTAKANACAIRESSGNVRT